MSLENDQETPTLSNKKVLYDLTYATRGFSGIPGDTRSVARILISLFGHNCDLLLFPKSYVKRRYFRNISPSQLSLYLGVALKINSGRTVLPARVYKVLLLLQSLSFNRKVQLLKVHEELMGYSLESVNLGRSANFTGELLVATIGNSTRFARSLKRKSFKINTSKYDFFVQQQIDPISVSRNTKHLVRLHDILPITHPQYFDDFAIYVFERGLRSLLKDKKILWVFDTNASALEFQRIFGHEREVKYIPCLVGSQFQKIPAKCTKTENLIVVINTIEPRKNVSKVIENFRSAKNIGLIPMDYTLAILGTRGWQDETLYQRLIEKKFGSDVEFIESPSNEIVADYLERSRIVVSASNAEGFGLPPLEGMLFGCIPVVSDIPQHRETLGDHGFYFNLEDNSLATALQGAHLKSISSNSTDYSKIQNHVVANFGENRIHEMWKNILK